MLLYGALCSFAPLLMCRFKVSFQEWRLKFHTNLQRWFWYHSNGWELNLAPRPHHLAVSGKAPTSWFNKRCEHTISTTVNTILIRIMFMIFTLDVLFSPIWCWKGCFSQPWQPLRFISRGLAERSQRHPDIVHEFHRFWDQRCGKRRTSSEFSAFDVSWLDLWPFDFDADGI